MNSGFAAQRSEVEAALLDYHHSPGKYPLLLRRPAVLFSSIREVLQLASGRLPDGAAPPSPAVQRAAGFFVRSALLHPAADHYALLGLERSSDASAIKERYRQMMRLMHPDFASAAGGSWPVDAASRINQAYEVLASSVQRREYDGALASGAGEAGVLRSERPRASGSAQLRATAASAPAQDPRARLKRIAGVFGSLGVVALGASLLATRSPSESLVQRAAPRDSPAAAAVTQATAVAPALLLPEPPPPESAAELDTAPPLTPNVQVAAFAPPSPAAQGRAAPLAKATPPLAPAGPVVLRVLTSASGNSAQGFAAAMPAPMPAAPPEAARVSAPVAQNLPAAESSPAAPVAPLAPVAAPARPPPASAVSLAEAHTLLSKLLQQMETGSGDRLLAGLERGARNAPGAQALLRQYNNLVEGARTVKVGNLQLRAEPRDDGLLVTGYVALEIGEYSALRSKELPLQAEFAKRGGTVVMTRLAPGQGIAEAGRKAD